MSETGVETSMEATGGGEAVVGEAPAAAGAGDGRRLTELHSVVEAIVYAAAEPATVAQIVAALGVEKAEVEEALRDLTERYAGDEFGIEIKPVAGGYRMASKPHHHESVRKFIKSLKPPVRLSLPALETLAVIAYRQPVTMPEIRDIRGVDPGGVINTLLDKKLITTAGRKEVVGKPILYRTTKEFLLQFGLSGIRDLPTIKEFEEMAQAGLEGLEEAAAPEAEGGELQIVSGPGPEAAAEGSGETVAAREEGSSAS